MSQGALALKAEARFNAVCPYFTMFPLEFPLAHLPSGTKEDRVIDPFCGRGTTNFAARLRGIPSVGADSNPVAAAIAKAKLAHTTAKKVVALCADILNEGKTPSSVPSGDFWQRAYSEKTLGEICTLREHFLKQCRSQTEITLRAVILGVLHGPRNIGEPSYLSNQMPRTYATKPQAATKFWRRHRLFPRTVSTLEIVKKRAALSLSSLPPRTDGVIHCGDSRTLDFSRYGKFNWVITSPPYPGMRTYVPDQWLRYWFLGGASDVAYEAGPQIASESVESFSSELGIVWRNVARACVPGARLIVRFGELPSVRVDARHLLKRSLSEAACGWRTATIRSAGTPRAGRRQADQFSLGAPSPYTEFDLYARLEA
jgi:hypothetical protein